MTVVECDVVPLVPVTVMVRVPVVARRLTVMVMVDDPFPVIGVELKPTVTLLPCPEADSETGKLKPPLTVLVILTWPDVLRLTVIDVGDALIENPAEVLVTVSITVVVCTVLPEVPVTVMG